MRIFGIMVVKDEVDIISTVLQHVSSWADRVFILDNGSTDGTWETITALRSDVIVPWKRDAAPFSQAMRGEVFRAFRHEARDGDWWCHKMDADEFYVDDPRKFVSDVPRRFHSVLKRSIDYVLTHQDLEEYTFSGSFDADRDKIAYISPTAHSERRFFRYRSTMRWQPGKIAPDNTGVPYPHLITVRHYQYRSPQQLQRRIANRFRVSQADPAGKSFRHVTDDDWRSYLGNRAELVHDDGSLDYRSVPARNRGNKPPLYDLKRRIGIAVEPFFRWNEA